MAHKNQLNAVLMVALASLMCRYSQEKQVSPCIASTENQLKKPHLKEKNIISLQSES